FDEVDGEPAQMIFPSLEIDVPVIDLRGVAAAQRAAQADRLAEGEACKRFDLSRLPLIRAVLLQLDDQDYMLLVTVHHIVSDGWSIGIISDELAALYKAPDSLPDPPIQYADFSIWQQDWLSRH